MSGVRDAAAIVTGHSRGLGAAIAEALLEREIPVLGISRSGNPRLAARHHRRLAEMAVDLADADRVRDWLAGAELAAFLAGVHSAMLVNNAGLLQPIGPLETQDPLAVQMAIAVNVGAALALSAAFVVASEAAAERRILHISSGAGRSAYAGWSVYCASKAALDHHARSVALDRTPRLRITSLAPGVIDTDMQAEIRASSEEQFPDRARFEAMKRDGTLVPPDEAGRRVVEFLLADSFGSDPVSDLRH